jgi:hypothetical protein
LTNDIDEDSFCYVSRHSIVFRCITKVKVTYLEKSKRLII